MRTKNIFKTLALAMLMPTMLLTTACSSEDDVVNSNIANLETVANKGYALPVTVNVTREGDKGSNRAAYTESTGKLAFGAGDKLFVSGSATGAGSFAGALDYVPATGKFSGTIYTKNDYDGTADALFSAASSVRANLLPAGYESYNFLYINNKSTDVLYDDVVAATLSNAFVASETAKKTGVEQLSWEQAYTYSSGFALAPANAVLNFTIFGLEAGAKGVTLITKNSGMDFDQTMSGSVTPNASGVATFAIGVPNNLVIKNVANNLTVGSSNFTLPGNTALATGKIYNITRGTGATVDLSTKNTAYTAQNGETLTGALASNVKISIADGATVLLKNVTITNLGENCDWAGINCPGNANLVLEGTNEVCAGRDGSGYNNYPGIYIAPNKTLTIQGDGTLTAYSDASDPYGAGIGGGYDKPCGNIVINSGNITAEGGKGAAGIGGGNTSCGNITINGGTVIATSGKNAAGIGGGNQGTCGAITINGGTITATGGEYAPGIGGGYRGTCGNIEISGGNITATGGDNAAGIGGGPNASCDNIVISGGTVTAMGGTFAAGIGSGYGVNASCGNINITSGVTSVTATKGTGATNSIGAGDGGTCGTVSIAAGANVTQN